MHGRGDTFSRSQENINRLMCMNYIKEYTKNEKELEFLIQIIRIYSQDIGMEFVIEKSTVLIMKTTKRGPAGGRELPNQESSSACEEKENK